MSRSAVMRRVALVLAVMMVTFVVPLGGGGNVALAAVDTTVTQEYEELPVSANVDLATTGDDTYDGQAEKNIETLRSDIVSDVNTTTIKYTQDTTKPVPLYTQYDNTVGIDASDFNDNTIIEFEQGTDIYVIITDGYINLSNVIFRSTDGGTATILFGSINGPTPVHAEFSGNNILFENITITGNNKPIDKGITNQSFMLTFANSSNIGFENVILENVDVNLTFDKNKNEGKHSAINLHTSSNININNLTISGVNGREGFGDIQMNACSEIYINNLDIRNSVRTNPIAIYTTSDDIHFTGDFNVPGNAIRNEAGAEDITIPEKYVENQRYALIMGYSVDSKDDPPKITYYTTTLYYKTYSEAKSARDGFGAGINETCAIVDTQTGLIIADEASGSYKNAFVGANYLTAKCNLKLDQNYLLISGMTGTIDTKTIPIQDATLFLVDDVEFEDFKGNLPSTETMFFTVNNETDLDLNSTSIVYNLDFATALEWTLQEAASALGIPEANFHHCKFKSPADITSVTPDRPTLTYTGGAVVVTVTGSDLTDKVTIKAFDQDGNEVLSDGSIALDALKEKATFNISFTPNTTTADIVYTIKVYVDGMEVVGKTATVTVRRQTSSGGGGGSTTTPTPTPTPTITPTPTPTQPIVTITPPPSIPAGTPTPAPTTGWQQGTGTNGPSYTYQDGTLAKGWKKLTPTTGGTEKWYYFDEDGKAISGWLLNGKNSGGVGSPAGSERWYYLNEAAGGTAAKPAYSMAVGWNKVHWKGVDNWYYFKADGVMYTGWFKDGKNADGTDRWYYLKPNRKQDQPMGSMATGWQKVDGVWYYFADSGVMQTGWLKNGNSWYYLKPSGAMVANAWQQVGGKWYWFNSSGAMVTGTQTINGKTYRFDSSGAWIS